MMYRIDIVKRIAPKKIERTSEGIASAAEFDVRIEDIKSELGHLEVATSDMVNQWIMKDNTNSFYEIDLTEYHNDKECNEKHKMIRHYVFKADNRIIQMLTKR